MSSNGDKSALRLKNFPLLSFGQVHSVFKSGGIFYLNFNRIFFMQTVHTQIRRNIIE